MNYKFDQHYVEALRFAMSNSPSRDYILHQLDSSLRLLKIKSDCITDVLSLLINLTNGGPFEELLNKFQNKWRPHLDRVYLRDYENTRWGFFEKFVFSSPQNLGRCLDVGCGRGCITANIIERGIASSIVGIDAEDFTSEWRERDSLLGKPIKFETVQVSRIEDWLQSEGQFDTILLFYVLHHSEEYWCARTLQALYRSLSKGGKIIVVEDSLSPTSEPIEDSQHLTKSWRRWVEGKKVYPLTAAYSVQVILDFVAVQILAGFVDVRMPCNYKTTKEWEVLFQDIGYHVLKSNYIGFPEGRDIDVPQSVFVLTSQNA